MSIEVRLNNIKTGIKGVSGFSTFGKATWNAPQNNEGYSVVHQITREILIDHSRLLLSITRQQT
jgi:hypothetical protein